MARINHANSPETAFFEVSRPAARLCRASSTSTGSDHVEGAATFFAVPNDLMVGECIKRDKNEAYCHLLGVGNVPDAPIPEEPPSLSPVSQPRSVELPWEETAEKRYPPPDPSRFTEYERRYPPDKYGEELRPNARLFKIYRDRVTEKDEDLVNGWNDTLNLMLVFAGLFSAVLTALLVESSKQLRPDYSQVTAAAVLAILAHLQGTNHTSLISLTSPFQPDNDARWINRLWFTSLMLALIVSLLAILVKQWLVQYMSLMRSSAGDAQHWALRHFALRRGLSKWSVEPFISWLAVLLHISLFLFFIGLVRFIQPLDGTTTAVIIVMSAVTAGFYLASTIAPLVWTECPYRTSLMLQLHAPFAWLRYFTQILFMAWSNLLLVIVGALLQLFVCLIALSIRCVLNRDVWSYFDSLANVLERLWQDLPDKKSTTFDSRLMVGREQQLTDDVILWVLGPENQLMEADTVVGIEAIGAVNFRTHKPQQLSLFRSAHISSAIDRQFRLLNRQEQASTAERAASIGRVLRAWVVADIPVDRDAAYRLSDIQMIRTHDVPILADELISRCSDGRSKSYEWLTRDVVVQLAVRSVVDPCWAALFGGNELAIYSRHNGRDAFLIKAITESRAVSLLVMFCLSPPEDVAKALSRLSDDGDSYDTMLRVLPKHLTGRSMLKPWHQYIIAIFSWAVSNLGTLELTAEDQNAIKRAYRSVFPRQMSEWLELGSALLPFATSPEFVQSCGEAEIDSAWNLVCDLRNRNIGRHRWSGVLEEVIFHLLERRAALHARNNPIKVCKLRYPGDIHTFVVDNIGRTASIDEFLQETTLNLLRQRRAAGGILTSTWRLYLSMRDNGSCEDTVSGRNFATALALLSRVGLEPNGAKALLHELVGDDRGIQLLLCDPESFVELAMHARTIDPQWWNGMKGRILNLPPTRWDARGFKNQHSSQQSVVDDIERRGPCEKCAEAGTQLRQILGSKPLAPTDSLARIDTVAMVKVANGTQPGAPVSADESLSSSSASSGHGGALTETATTEPQNRTGAELWACTIAPIRAITHLATSLSRPVSDLEMQTLRHLEEAGNEI